MNTIQSRQGRHSIRELEDWTKEARHLRFYPGTGHGMGYVGERLRIALVGQLTPSALAELKQLATSAFPVFFIEIDPESEPRRWVLTAKPAVAMDADLTAAHLTEGLRLEKWLEQRKGQYALETALPLDAERYAFPAP